jgi:hypothetical protein
MRQAGGAFNGVVEGLSHRSQLGLPVANTCDIHLKLNRTRNGLSVPAQQHDFENAEVVLSNRSQDGKFDVLGMRRDCSGQEEGREERADYQRLCAHGDESTKPSVCVKKVMIS